MIHANKKRTWGLKISMCVFLYHKKGKAMKTRNSARLVYDTLILLGVFTVILFMCRLWPLILLCILGLLRR